MKVVGQLTTILDAFQNIEAVTDEVVNMQQVKVPADFNTSLEAIKNATAEIRNGIMNS